MGTAINLTVSGVSLSYSKNHMGIDYGFLFQPTDLARRPSDAINYEYYAEHPEEEAELAESELGFVRGHFGIKVERMAGGVGWPGCV